MGYFPSSNRYHPSPNTEVWFRLYCISMELSVPRRYLGQLMVIFHEDLLRSSILPVAPLNLTPLIGWQLGLPRWKRALIGSLASSLQETRTAQWPQQFPEHVVINELFFFSSCTFSPLIHVDTHTHAHAQAYEEERMPHHPPLGSATPHMKLGCSRLRLQMKLTFSYKCYSNRNEIMQTRKTDSFAFRMKQIRRCLAAAAQLTLTEGWTCRNPMSSAWLSAEDSSCVYLQWGWSCYGCSDRTNLIHGEKQITTEIFTDVNTNT